MATAVDQILSRLERSHSSTRQKWWISVAPKGVVLPPHGWKLHVSSRSVTYLELLDLLVPVLLDDGCAFKLVRSPAALTELNDGVTSPSAVGKAVTIYPDQERVRELGFRLAALLRGHVGPRILSDRRVDPSPPVYYRYGPFVRSGELDGFGRSRLTLHGPNGEEFEGAATTSYRVPNWATDPFEGTAAHTGTLLGGRYRATVCVYESARGNIYRAVDEETGRQVVVKQARAHVAESAERADARIRLRNERRIMELAHGTPGVPRFVDHFRHADDEYLVSEDVGAVNLADDVIDNGRYLPGGRRSLARLASNLARIVADLHSKGILVRDLKPSNVVVGATGGVHLIDFGSATYGGVVLSGHTLPYSPPRQVRGDAPTEADDLYALGMTLIEAVTGMRPVASDDDPGLSRRCALDALCAAYGDRPTGIIATIVELLSDDPATARTTFNRLVAGEHAPSNVALPRTFEVSADGIGDLVASVRSELLVEVDTLLERPPQADASAATRADPSVLTGTAGIGLELLEHLEVPGVGDRIARLVATTEQAVAREGMPPGLFVGSTGAEIFLRRAGAVDPLPKRDLELSDLDLFEGGAAGVGLAYLWRAAETGDPDDLLVADACARQIADTRPGDTGLAHGRAGLTLFRVALVQHGRLDPGAIDNDLADLARVTSQRIAAAAPVIGNPLRHASWCNGLAGSARTLLYAGQVLDRPDLSDLALSAGDVCAQWVPQLAALGQCCGAAGVGDVLLDLARVEGGERHMANASQVVRHICLRSGGTPEAPLVGATLPRIGRASWGMGLAGILGFLRRLHTGGPRIC